MQENMRAVDRAWLEMDEPHNPMVVAAILEFEGVEDTDALAEGFVSRLLLEPRFRERADPQDGAWIEDDELHLGYHVQIHTLRPDTPEPVLRAAISKEMSRPLDHALPLWRIALFDRGEGKVTLLFRAHHAIADGVSMLQMLLRLSGNHANGRDAELPANAHHHGPLGSLIDRLETVNTTLEGLTELVMDDLRNPQHLSKQLRQLKGSLAAVGRVLTLPDDNPSLFRAPPCGHRSVAWTRRLSLNAVKNLAKAQCVSLNDIFLTALAGAFGRYLREIDGRVPEEQNLRVSVPVNLRREGDNGVGNHFGLVLVDLPVGLEGWHARLEVISDRMQALKQSPEANSVLVALSAAGHLPVAAERRLVGLVGNKAAAVVSNLPGPRRALRLGRAKLANVVFWPPQAGRIGVGVSLLSYAGHVTVGVSADAAQVEQPQRLVEAFCEELDQMLGRASKLSRRAPSRSPHRPSAH